ncbi:MAG: diguanylate cyclase domain-containing protein [Lachnospiraceae bacterium]
MTKRKLIGLILPNPEEAYQHRIMKGIFEQCKKYDYDVAVFSTLVAVTHPFPDYLKGEATIYDIMNLNELDGIVIGTLSVCKNDLTWLYDILLKKLEKFQKPVVSIDLPFGDYKTVYTDDASAFSKITAHVLDVHHCKNIYFLTGTKGHDVSEERLSGFLREMGRRGIPVPEEHIFYGNFWYNSGEELADRIVAGELEKPDAVICASDHMAIGVANRFQKRGIKVPEDVIVTGFDATAEAAINDLSITTYRPDVDVAARKAINEIRRQIEPGANVEDTADSEEDGLRICASCGCQENVAYVKSRLNDSLYNVHQNFYDEEIQEKIGISRLLESYMYEELTNTGESEECFEKIYQSLFLIQPFSHCYLCLREDWLDIEEGMENQFPQRMKMVISATAHKDMDVMLEGDYATNSGGKIFERTSMLPNIREEQKEASVFYFVPIHFLGDSLGYFVLQCSLEQEHKINHVFRNWVRYVNNALKMIAVQNKLRAFSERDAMTGLYNRRGMKVQLENMFRQAHPGESMFVCVVDMDGLKAVNDLYGHEEGDYAIGVIASMVNAISKSNELSVRAGGDEFYIIGVADYAKEEGRERKKRLENLFERYNRRSSKAYEISASIGYCLQPYESEEQVKHVLHIADQRMYQNKVERKKQRTI